MIASGPLLAAWASGLGALLLACLAPGMGVAARAGQVVVGVATLAAVVPWALSGATGPGVEFSLIATLLGVTLPLASPHAGTRPRLARALPGAMVAATLLAVTAADRVTGTLALAVCGLAAGLAAGCARGNEAALAAWRLLRLQGVAIGTCLLGLILARRTGLQGAGELVLCVGVAALGGLAPFGPALARAQAAAPSPLDGLVIGLLPLAAFARLLTLRPALPPTMFVIAGVLAMALGVMAAWRAGGARRDGARQDGARRDGAVSLGLGGIVTAGLGLGDAGVAGSILALAAGAVALSVLPLARRCDGWSGAAARLSCGLPPFGLFGGIVLVLDAAPALWLRGLVAVLACALLAALVRARTMLGDQGEDPTRVGRVVLWLHVAAGLAIGVAR